MDKGGEEQNEVWADYCSEQRNEPRPRGAGAQTWILGRRNGLARGIYNRLIADDWRTGRQILAGAQWCLDTE